MTTHHPLGYCPDHGLFLATGFGLSHVTGARLIGNRQSCPQCRRLCEVISGTYSTWGDKLNVILDPSVSPEALAAIREIVSKAQSGEYSHERAAAEVKKISPKVGRLFDIPNWDPQAKATLYASIIAAAAAFGVAKIGADALATARAPYVIQKQITDIPTPTQPKAPPIPKPNPRRQ